MNKYSFLSILVIATATLLLVSVWFYWYEIRPTNIRKQCAVSAQEEARQVLVSKSTVLKQTFEAPILNEAVGQGMYMKEDYDTAFQQCLFTEGITQ